MKTAMSEWPSWKQNGDRVHREGVYRNGDGIAQSVLKKGVGGQAESMRVLFTPLVINEAVGHGVPASREPPAQLVRFPKRRGGNK